MWRSADTNDTSSAGGMPLTFSVAALPGPEILRKLDPPMSNWFCSVPHAMDTISYSIKAREIHCSLPSHD